MENIINVKFNSFMASGFKAAYFCSVNGQITATVVNDCRGIFITTTIYGENQDYSWGDVGDRVAAVFDTLSWNKVYSSEAEAIAVVEATFRKTGVKYVSGVDAWARRVLQFSPISYKWRKLKANVPRRDLPLDKYREILLVEWESASWHPTQVDVAKLFAACARHIML